MTGAAAKAPGRHWPVQWRVLLALLLPAWLWGASGAAWAHADGRANIRVVHFTYDAAGMTAYYRVSLALLARGPGGALAPYAMARSESGRTFHYVRAGALDTAATMAAAALATGHAVTLDGASVAPRLLSAVIHVKGAVPPFANAEQARLATRPPSSAASPPPQGEALIEIGDMLLDAAVFYPAVRPDTPFAFSSALQAGQLNDAPIHSVLLSHAAGATTQYSHSGVLTGAITVNPPALQAFLQFVRAGAAHILDGYDHLLLVVCLVAGDLRLRAIALKISAFSAGHALSIVAGFYGVLPQAEWSEPVIELLIALSVLGAALMLARQRGAAHPALLTFLVGVVHGCGLAIGLRAILSDSGPNIVTSLLSFNVGVEMGQLAVGAGVWLLLCAAQTLPRAGAARIRGAIALTAAVIALLWVGDRAPPAWNALYAASAPA
jgi:hypothetical protein